MRILVVDDELAIQQYLINIISDNYKEWTVTGCSVYEEALALADENTFDLFIVDYELDKNNKSKNGYNLGLELKKSDKYKQTPIIFETSYSEYIFDALNNLNCIYYLVKPYDDAKVISMIDKILTCVPVKKTISLKDVNGISAYVQVDDIIYAEATGHRICIYMPGTHIECYRISLEELSNLCEGTLVRTHKSFLVNKNYIQNIDKVNKYVTVRHPAGYKSYTIKIGRAYSNMLI